jgi:hypothetical protein
MIRIFLGRSVRRGTAGMFGSHSSKTVRRTTIRKSDMKRDETEKVGLSNNVVNKGVENHALTAR